MTSGAALSCEGVEASYGPVQVLFGVDMEVAAGEIVALLGTNGAGKSTLLRAVSQLIEPTGGSIRLDDGDITRAGPMRAVHLGIVQVPGGRAIFPTLTVAEHFKAATWLGRHATSIDERTEHVLDLFPRLRERMQQMAGNLSGGEQQQLGLGMAFVMEPRLLLIDELSLGLAPNIVHQLLRFVRQINSSGCTVVLVEQSVNVALRLAERAYFMEKGEVRFNGPTADLLERPELLRSVFLEGRGTRKRPRRRTAKTEGAPVVLAVSGLSKHFGGITAVDDVGFSLAGNRVVGLIGPNGAGKTTIFDLVSGLLSPDAGEIHLLGEDVTKMSADVRAMRGLGRSFQDARLFPSLTVSENIATALERHLEVRDHFASILGLPDARRMEDDIELSVEELLELLNLKAFRDKFVGELSTGSRRVVDLAMAIAHRPAVLLLDEPSSGIAQREAEALVPLLDRIRRELGCALLVIEHDMPLLSAIADEIVALEMGRVIARGSPKEVRRDPRVVASYLGENRRVIRPTGAVRARRTPSSSRARLN